MLPDILRGGLIGLKPEVPEPQLRILSHFEK